MSTLEQLRNFIRGFRPELVQSIMQCLQLRFPMHVPKDPYNVDDIYNAANFAVGGHARDAAFNTQPVQAQQPAVYQQLPIPAIPTAATASADPTAVKIEALTAVVASLGEMFKMVLQTQQESGKPRNVGPRPIGVPGSACNFCGGSGHFIRECEVVTEYSRVGKCKRCADSKVVLPSGVMVPCDIPGNWLRDRVDEWHRLNPGQTALQMILEVVAAQPVTALASESVSQSSTSCPAWYVGQYSEVSQAGSYALRRVPGPCPEANAPPRPVRNNPAPIGSSSNSGDRGIPSPFERELPPHLACGSTSPDNTGMQIEEVNETSHPYAAKGVIEVSQHAAPALCKHDPAYTTTAKIHDNKVALDIYNCAMEIPITVTQCELLSLAPELRAQVTDATIKWRIPREVTQVLIKEINDTEDNRDEDAQDAHMPAVFTTACTPPIAAEVLHNTYLKAIPETPDPQEEVEVMAESNALRAILPVVDRQ